MIQYTQFYQVPLSYKIYVCEAPEIEDMNVLFTYQLYAPARVQNLQTLFDRTTEEGHNKMQTYFLQDNSKLHVLSLQVQFSLNIKILIISSQDNCTQII